MFDKFKKLIFDLEVSIDKRASKFIMLLFVLYILGIII